MAYKTFAQLYNDALSVADETSGSGSAAAKMLIKSGINEAYSEIAAVRDWKTLENSGSIPTVSGTFEYAPVTASASVPRIRRIQSVIDETSNRYLEETQRERFEQVYPYVNASAGGGQGSPLYWFQSGYTSNRDIKIKVYPVPGSALSLRAFWYEEPLELSADTDIPRVPDQWHYGLSYLGLAKYYEFQKDPIAGYYRGMHEAYKSKVLASEYDDSTEMPSVLPQGPNRPFVLGKVGRAYN